MAESEREIERVEFKTEFSACPSCGYGKGFHNIFRKVVENGKMEWFLICPGCGKTYDIGLSYVIIKK